MASTHVAMNSPVLADFNSAMRSLKLSKKFNAKNFSSKGTDQPALERREPSPPSLSPPSLSFNPFRPPPLSLSPPLSRAIRIAERTLARLLARGLACAGKSIPYRSVATTTTTLLLPSPLCTLPASASPSPSRTRARTRDPRYDDTTTWTATAPSSPTSATKRASFPVLNPLKSAVALIVLRLVLNGLINPR